MEPILEQRIRTPLWRTRLLRIVVALASVWIVAALIAFALVMINQNGVEIAPHWPKTIFWTTAGLTLLSVLLASAWPVSAGNIIREIEDKFPELDSALITAAEQEGEGGRLNFLQMDVLRSAIAHSYENSWAKIVPEWKLLTIPLAGLLGLLGFFAAIVVLLFFPAKLPEDLTIQFADAVNAGELIVEVEPGDCDVEEDTSLLVLARFPDAVPAEATLVYTRQDGSELQLPMNKSLDDPMFGRRIESVDGPLTYHVAYGGSNDRTVDYKVNVFKYPALVRADAQLEFPEYTKQPAKIVQDVRRLTAVEGTKLKLDLFLNKPVQEARLIPVRKKQDDEGEFETLELNVDSSDSRRYSTQWTLAQSQRYRLELIDDDGRNNRVPPTIVVNVSKNREPKIKVLLPSTDIQASPLEEVQMAAEAWDDFDVVNMGIAFGKPGSDPTVVKLETSESRPKWKRADYLMALETMEVKPDDLISYYFWVEDIAADGQLRLVASDIFFIEVRRFDQIFRQGQAQPQGQQQQQQSQQGQQGPAAQAGELAEIQKQVMTGTWNLKRKQKQGESDLPRLPQEFGSSVEVLVGGQKQALEALAELAENVQDPQAQSVIESIGDSMNRAVDLLNEGNEKESVTKLEAALTQEQLAYQGLLRMRALESEVSMQQQQQQQQGGAAGGQRQQQQLDQLNIDQDENRYEEEKTAQEELDSNDPEAAADREVMNRLKELSRRQEDLNERIKELVTELESAETEEDREEIERRLKSLREQQQQMLRDADELLEQMNREENRERMAEEADQLAETRENLRKAADSLDERELSQAAAEGTRAQRELEDLRDEFKQRTAGQFNEQMREMRNQAQDIQKKQNEIAERMGGDQSDAPDIEEPAKPKSLWDEEDEPTGEELEKQLADQQKAVEDLRRKMRETIEEAETTEPLLAESLYETYRDSEANRPDEALQMTRLSLARGWQDDAMEQQQRAAQGIDELKRGIEAAAEQVLGDETAALRAAAEALEELNNGIQSELDGNQSDSQGDRNSRNGEGADSENPDDGDPNSEQSSESRGGEGAGENTDPDSQESRQEREQPTESNSQPNGQGNRSGQSPEGDRSSETDDPTEPSQQDENSEGQANRERDSAGSGRSDASDEERESGDRPAESGDRDRSDQPQDSEEASQQSDSGQSEQSGQGQSGQSSNPEEGEPGQQPAGQQNGSPTEQNQDGRGGGEGQDQREAELEAMNEAMRQLGSEPSQNPAENGAQDAGRSRTANAGNQRMRPITGDDFRKWNDQLRDVEEMLDDPDLRAEASRIRQEAREIRKDLKERNSPEPNWELVKLKVAEPLSQLQQKVADEILRRTSKEARVPINRDPVPAEYQDAVQKYYRRLGVGQ